MAGLCIVDGMNTLICHHLEPIWNDALLRIGGLSIEDMCKRVAEYLLEHDIDRVIITQFELARHPESEACYWPVMAAIEEKDIRLEWHEYGYGWKFERFKYEDIATANYKINCGHIVSDQYGTKLARGGSHSEVVIIEDWQERLRHDKVWLCGAFRNECLEDMEIALEACHVQFEHVHSLIV